MKPAVAGSASQRLLEVDSLRGVAAVLVMLFHYTTRYNELYTHVSAPAFTLPWGHYGVNLFFIISGFVIFMTLERTRRPMDFVVSRFSRLFPAYWVAVAVTFLVTSWAALPGKVVETHDAVLNFLMIHGLFRIPHVDAVYWTLEVELLFYAYMLLLFRLRWLSRIHGLLILWLGLRWVYFIVDTKLGISLPFLFYRLAILAYIPFFAIGISVFLGVRHPGEYDRRNAVVIGLALLTLGVAESLTLLVVAVLGASAMWLAATGRLKILRTPALVWLGLISYTLYLLHENVGWSVILVLERAGVPANAAIAGAIVIAVGAASLLTVLVERPAMRAIRSHYKAYRATSLAPS